MVTQVEISLKFRCLTESQRKRIHHKYFLYAENYISVVFVVRSTIKTNIFGQETLSNKMATIFCSPSAQADAETWNLSITRLSDEC